MQEISSACSVQQPKKSGCSPDNSAVRPAPKTRRCSLTQETLLTLSLTTRHPSMVASFEFNITQNLNKKTDRLYTRAHASRGNPPTTGRRPYTAEQNLWYRSDGYFVNAVAAKKAAAAAAQMQSSQRTTIVGQQSPRGETQRPSSSRTATMMAATLDSNDDTTSLPWTSPRRDGPGTSYPDTGSSPRPTTTSGAYSPRSTGMHSSRSSQVGSAGAGMFATMAQKPLTMTQCWEKAATSPRWQGPGAGWANELLPPGSRPARFAGSLMSLTSRAITDEERMSWSPRSRPSKHNPVCKPAAL